MPEAAVTGNARTRLLQISARLNSDTAHGWARAAQAAGYTLGAGLAVAVIGGLSRSVLLWLAWPIVVIVCAGGLWVLLTLPADRERLKEEQRTMERIFGPYLKRPGG